MDIIYRKRPPVVSWNDLKECMRARFVPPFRKDNLLKFQRLPQGHRMVDEYFKDFETTLTKMNMHANEESKIKWFVRGLRRDIRDLVELNEYSSLKRVCRIAIKVESYLLKKTFKNTHDDGFYNSSRKDANKVSTTNPSTLKSPPKPSNIKCFKCLGYGHIASNCPSKRNMFVHNGIVMSEHDSDSPRHSSPSRASSENESENPLEGDLLVVRRLLGQVSQPFDESQRENIFHTRCLIQNNICSLIVDGGSCANVASTRVVDKLGLPTISHTKPYKLQWLSEVGEIIVNKQVLIHFSIGKYKDEVLCDFVPMEAVPPW